MDAGHINSAEEPWSYVVGLASFIAQTILGGYVYTTGIFYTVFRQQFPESSEVTLSWMCSMPITLLFIMGPLGSMLTNRFGCRVCVIVGGLLCSTSLSLCFFASDIYTVFIFYGLLAGMGNGILYIGAIAVVNQYFKKYRLAANVITPSGLTFGMAVYAAIIPILNETYGWRGTLLILGGISFNICALGCLLFPRRGSQKVTERKIIKLKILKDHHFQLYVIQCMFCNMSSSLIFVHLHALIISFNLGATTASLSLTLYGIANCSGKIFHSIIGVFRKPNAPIVYTCSLVICGSAMILIPLIQDRVWILILVNVSAFTYCVTGGHNVEVILYLIGQENVSDGLGFALVAKATGSLLAGPLAGLLYSGTKLYSTSFYVGGSLMLLGCILLIPIIKLVINRRKDKKNEVVYIVSTEDVKQERKDIPEHNSSNGVTEPMLG